MPSFPSVLESIKDLNKDQVNDLLDRARYFKRNITSANTTFNKKPPTVASFFLENSTRTVNSFAVACMNLGINYLAIDAKTTSLKKGESLRETFLTLHHQGIDAVIMRTSEEGLFEEFKVNDFPLALINAGDGTNQHPTQALLDLFTLIDFAQEVDGKTLLLVGDCLHSRVANSLIDLLPQFGIKIIICGPKKWTKNLDKHKNIIFEDNINTAIKKSDFIYLLRIQKERHGQSDDDTSFNYHEEYGVNLNRLEKLNKLIPVLHPGPFNKDVEISMDLVNSPYYFGYKQVENSIYVRMAILELILKRTGTIYE